jgi:hypothetical protein
VHRRGSPVYGGALTVFEFMGGVVDARGCAVVATDAAWPQVQVQGVVMVQSACVSVTVGRYFAVHSYGSTCAASGRSK